MNAGFGREARVPGGEGYRRVFQSRRVTGNRYFRCHYAPNAQARARLGLAVSRRVAARAHERNRLKRLIRESFRQRTLPAVDVIVVALAPAAGADNATLFGALEALWDRLETPP